MFGSPNSLNSRSDNSRIRSRVRRGAFWSMEAGMLGRLVDDRASITSNGRAGIVSAGSGGCGARRFLLFAPAAK
jgi:hypothetical protein